MLPLFSFHHLIIIFIFPNNIVLTLLTLSTLPILVYTYYLFLFNSNISYNLIIILEITEGELDGECIA
jgi:hypothetical protein